MKNILLLLFLSAPLVGGAPLPADYHTGKPACCGLSAAAVPFTKKSLYQSEAGFTTDAGASFSLGELRGYPVVLAMFFTSCGYACPLIVSDMQAIRAQLPAEVRDRTRFVLVSFDTIRDTPDALAKYRVDRKSVV